MSKIKTRRIIFIHLDLGIGGAEQLIINLATASIPRCNGANNVKIYTTHCSQSHCFDEVNYSKKGILANCVRLRGTFIPDEVKIPFVKRLGGRALFSSIRILYLSVCAILEYLVYTFILSSEACETLFVVDVLPTALPLIQWFISLFSTKSRFAGVLFYCHFPDKVSGIFQRNISL